MKKSFLSIILAVLVIITTFSVSSFAYSHIYEDLDFDKFGPADWTSAGAKYGTLTQVASPVSGVISYSADETNDRDNEGKSIKIQVNANSSISTDPGIIYTFDQAQKGIVKISLSHYIESHEKSSYIYRYLQMITASGSTVNLAVFTDLVNYTTFWNGTSSTGYSKQVPYPTDAWIDIDIIYDLNNNNVTYKMESNGNVIYNQSFTNNLSTYADGITGFKFITQTPKWLSSKYGSGTSAYANKEVIYLDNVKVETLESMTPVSENKTVDYNSITPSSTVVSSVSLKPINIPCTNAYANISGGSGFNYLSTDRGVSLNFVRPTGAKSNAQYRINISPYVPTIKGKVSLRVPDTNIAKPMYIITDKGDYISTVLFYDNGKLIIFGNTICEYKINTWYDIEYYYNAQNGDYFYRVGDGENIYTGSGVYDQASGDSQTIQSVFFQLNKAGTSLLIDDLMLDTVDSDFRMDKDLSTTNKTIVSNEAVYARFTKELNETPQSIADKVFEYYGNAQITSVSLLDKYTIMVEFEKEMGKSYRFDFKNITAKDGSITTDYIEFDVEKPDLVMSDVIFTTADDEVLSLIKPGTLKANFNANSNNGKSFNFLYALGLYNDGELVSVSSNPITVNETNASYSLKITVPNNSNTYIAKAFIWDAVTLEPVTKPYIIKPTPDGKPVAIVKMDDLRADYDHYLDPFISMINWADENGIRVSTGLIASSLDTDDITDEQKEKLNIIKNASNNEIWFHGYENASSSDPTFRRSKEEQKADFESGMAAGARNGINFTAFGPPSNAMNTDTVDVINENFPDIKAVVNLVNGAYGWELNNAVEVSYHIKVEPNATGQTDTLENLKSLWNSQYYRDHLILQVHPVGWAQYDGSMERYQDFLLWLKDQGVVFMTPTEFAEYKASLS